MKTKDRAVEMILLEVKSLRDDQQDFMKKIAKLIKDKKLMTMFQPADDKENVESLNAGYMAETAPYGTYVTNKK